MPNLYKSIDANLLPVLDSLIGGRSDILFVFDIIRNDTIINVICKNTQTVISSALSEEIGYYLTEEINLFESGNFSDIYLLLSGLNKSIVLYKYFSDGYNKIIISLSGSKLSDSKEIIVIIKPIEEEIYLDFKNFANNLESNFCPVFVKNYTDNTLDYLNSKGYEFLKENNLFFTSDKYSELTQSPIGIPFIFSLFDTDGKERFYQFKKIVEINFDGSQILIEYLNDITLIIDLQKRYLHSYELINQFSEQFDLIPWHLDLGNKELIIEFDKINIHNDFNSDFIRKKVRFKDLKDLLYPDDFQIINKIKKESYKTNYLSFRNNIRLFLKEEKAIPFQLTGIVDLRSKTTPLVFGYIKNLKKIEVHNDDIRLLNKEAESLHAFQTAFLKIIHHELRAPVNKLIGYTETLIHKTNAVETDKMAYFKKIKSYTKKLLSILDSSLEYSYTEPEIGSEDKNETIYLSKFLNIVTDVVKSKNNKIKIQTDYDREIIISTYKIEKLAVAISCLVFCYHESNPGKIPFVFAKVIDDKLQFIIGSNYDIDPESLEMESITYLQFLDRNLTNKSLELDMDIAISFSLLVNANISLFSDNVGNNIFQIETSISKLDSSNDLSYKMIEKSNSTISENIIFYENENIFSSIIYETLNHRYKINYVTRYSNIFKYLSNNSSLIFSVKNIDNELILILSTIIRKSADTKILVICLNENLHDLNLLYNEDLLKDVEILFPPFNIEIILDFLTGNN